MSRARNACVAFAAIAVIGCGEPPTATPVHSRALRDCTEFTCQDPTIYDHTVVSLSGHRFFDGYNYLETTVFDLHPTSYRMRIDWREIETSPGTYGGAVAGIHSAVDKLESHGIRVYFHIMNPPTWTMDVNCAPIFWPCGQLYHEYNPPHPAYQGAWQAFMAYMVNEFRETSDHYGVKYWGYGNENDRYFMTGDGYYPRPVEERFARFMQMYSDFADAVHTVPGNQVVGLELSSANTGNSDFNYFLNNGLAQLGYKFDIVGAQVYHPPAGARQHVWNILGSPGMSQGSWPLWITEIGGSDVMGQQDQANWIVDFVGEQLRNPIPRLQQLFVFGHFTSTGTTLDPYAPQWGMVNVKTDETGNFVDFAVRTLPYNCLWDVSHGIAPENGSSC